MPPSGLLLQLWLNERISLFIRRLPLPLKLLGALHFQSFVCALIKSVGISHLDQAWGRSWSRYQEQRSDTISASDQLLETSLDLEREKQLVDSANPDAEAALTQLSQC